MIYQEALTNCLFRYISGSHAYGTERPDSDQDIRGVFIAPLTAAFDLFHSSEVGGTLVSRLKNALDNLEVGNQNAAVENIQAALEPDMGDLNLSVGTVHKAGSDEELQELRKFFKLAAQCNPNIVEYLFVDRLILQETPQWRKIRENKSLFLSKKARWTFSGYAIAQLKRIETHRNYLLHPPSHKPSREEYGLQNETLFSKENQNAILSIPDTWIVPEAKEYVRKEKAYKMALDAWVAYKRWETERNPARKILEAKCQYDSKHATHLIRLCRMAKEILKDGIVNVYRPDREELKSIIRGEWKYEQVLEEANKMDAELDILYKVSPLRDKPDFKKISELYQEICEEFYSIKLRK